MKSITCKASNNIVASSTRDRNDAAVVMQINFTELTLKCALYHICDAVLKF